MMESERYVLRMKQLRVVAEEGGVGQCEYRRPTPGVQRHRYRLSRPPLLRYLEIRSVNPCCVTLLGRDEVRGKGSYRGSSRV